MSKIVIIARWEVSQMSADDEWQIWRQLKGAYQVSEFVFVPPKASKLGCPQYDTMEEALEKHAQGNLCFLEPKGTKDMTYLAALSGQDITLVLGNTEYDNLSIANPDDTYRIDTPGASHLYGCTSAGIALSHWYYGP